MKARVLILTVLILASLTRAAPALDLVLDFEGPAEMSRVLTRLETWQPARLDAFAGLLGLDVAENASFGVRVIVAPESMARELGAPKWVAGYARSDANVIVLFPSRVPAYPYSSLEELLGHEVAHLLIDRAAAGRSLPRWFHEGLAMLAEEAWGLEDRTRVALALIRRGGYNLTGLDARFGDPGEVRSAYALAGAFLRDLVNSEGPDLPARLLQAVSEDVEFDTAFKSVVGRSLDEAEESFWQRYTFWYRWVPILTSSSTLWIGIVLLTLAAAGRRRRRTRALEERWELEDARRESARYSEDSTFELEGEDEPPVVN